uniref:FBA_2 domain-containing protein n=1 Tax=Caenorhabditis tropicalis TaxID=1561998 RepID=A0A1I7V0T3_9PELO
MRIAYPGIMEVVCSDPMTAINIFLKHAKDLFNCKNTTYWLAADGVPDLAKFITETVNTDTSCKELMLIKNKKCQFIKPKDAICVLENCTTDVLFIGDEITPFEERPVTISCKFLYMASANFFDLANVLNSNCQRAIMREMIDRSPALMNSYLKEWINGEHSEMTNLLLIPGFFDFIEQELFDGIEKEVADKSRNMDDYVLPFDWVRGAYPSWYKECVFKEYDIRRNDGTIATVSCCFEFFVFHVWRLK